MREGPPDKEDRKGTVKGERENKKGHQKRDKGRKGSDRKRFRDTSPSFKSYSMTNKLPLSFPPLHARLTASLLPWWSGLPIATAGGVVPWDWQRRQLASDCLSVRPRASGWVLGRHAARLHSYTALAVSLCVCCSAGLCFWSRSWGWSPHICWEEKLTDWWQIHCWKSLLCSSSKLFFDHLVHNSFIINHLISYFVKLPVCNTKHKITEHLLKDCPHSSHLV